MANWKFNESQFNIACTSSLLLYMIIANTIFDPKCYSPESQLQEQNKQDRTFPVLYTVAWLHSTEPQTTQNDIMINTAKHDYPQARWTQVWYPMINQNDSNNSTCH